MSADSRKFETVLCSIGKNNAKSPEHIERRPSYPGTLGSGPDNVNSKLGP